MDFVPNQSYIDKNKKPENMSVDDIVKLGNAYRIAQSGGLLPDDSRLQQLFLANAMTENRPQNFGVNTYNPYLNKWHINALEKMGVDNRVLEGGDFEQSKVYPVDPVMVRNSKGKLVPDWKAPLGRHGNDVNSRLAAYIFADKYRLLNKDPLKTVERWNGKGKFYDKEGNVKADSKNHLRKVLEMEKMMADPRNSRIRQLFDKARSGLIEYP